MIVTVVVMNIFKHGQPALLYLVPSVLIALWGTALVRGEFKLMWRYTEDGSIDVDPGTSARTPAKPPAEKVKERSDDSTSSGNTNHSGSTDSSGGGAPLGAESGNTSVTEGEKTETGVKEKKKGEKDEHAHHVFLFSLSEPRLKKAKLFESNEITTREPAKTPSLSEFIGTSTTESAKKASPFVFKGATMTGSAEKPILFEFEEPK
jgi:minor histocompatibility antigen H13